VLVEVLTERLRPPAGALCHGVGELDLIFARDLMHGRPPHLTHFTLGRGR